MISSEEIKKYCMLKLAVEHEYKTSWEADVFKIGGKMFAFMGGDKGGQPIINLKNEPRINLDLREQYIWVTPGYYSNKDHWNSWYFKKTEANWEILKAQIDKSYDLVVSSLTKNKRAELGIESTSTSRD